MKNIFFIVFLVLGMGQVSAQVAINTDGSLPHPSAMLDVKSDRLGFLPPRVNSLGDIQNPAPGLMAYQTSNNTMYYYNGVDWIPWVSGQLQKVYFDIMPNDFFSLEGYGDSINILPPLGLNNFYDIVSAHAFLEYNGIPYVTDGLPSLALAQGNTIIGHFDAELLLSTTPTLRKMTDPADYFDLEPIEFNSSVKIVLYGNQLSLGNSPLKVQISYIPSGL
jgi:hypothetical protein